MKPLSLAVAASLALTPLAATPHASAKNDAKRHNVLDAFYLLPGIGALEINSSRKWRREMLQPKYKPIIDLNHDYLKFRADASPDQEVAIFRYRGAELVATSTPDSVSDYNAFHLYRFSNGKLREVTEKELPIPARADNYLYELPRIGTTIRVYKFDLSKQKRWHAFDLKWRGGRFVKAALR